MPDVKGGVVMKVKVGIVLLVVTAALAPNPATADLDESRPFICPVNTVMECHGSGQCLRHTADKHPDFPTLMRVNLAQKTIVDASIGATPRTTEIKATTRLDGRLVLHGGENGRGWAATIAQSNGHMSAGVVADEYAFALFG